jgi:hypothetical protein
MTLVWEQLWWDSSAGLDGLVKHYGKAYLRLGNLMPDYQFRIRDLVNGPVRSPTDQGK